MTKIPGFNALIATLESHGYRTDAEGYAFLEQELLKIRSKTYDVLYPELRARQLIPVDHEVPAGAETFAYDSWDTFGEGKIGGNDTDDPPLAEVLRSRTTGRIVEVRSGYKYTILELANQMMAGIPLNARRAEAARKAIERKLDKLLAYGDATVGQLGFLELAGAGVLSTTPTTGTWSAPATAVHIMEDLNKLVNEMVAAAGDTEVYPDTLVLPVSLYNRIATTPYSDYHPQPILKVFLDNSPWIKSVVPWLRAGYNSAGGARNRIVCYNKSDQVLQAAISQEFTQLAPQPRNYAFLTPCYLRTGGVELHYSFGIRYMDGC